MSEKLEKALSKNEWPLVKASELTLVFSPLLKSVDSLAHAFTTRLGGGSPSPLDSFNLGRHWDSEESRQDAMANRRRLCQLLELDAAALAVPGQKHTSNIEVLDGDSPESQGPYQFPAIDAIATSRKAQPVLLHFADCVPVMLVDREKLKLCVIHAGWRGTAGSIVRKSVELMKSRWGSNTDHIAAAVGPAIGSCCYETGQEVVEALGKTVETQSGLVKMKDGKPYPDLKAYNAMQLLESGVRDIDVSQWCTACHPEIFYSHRQSGGKTGRQGALACLL